jgi:hypothetical protein
MVKYIIYIVIEIEHIPIGKCLNLTVQNILSNKLYKTNIICNNNMFKIKDNYAKSDLKNNNNLKFLN